MSQKFVIGERVRVTVCGAVVEDLRPSESGTSTLLRLRRGQQWLVLDPAAPGVQVQRHTPEHWPPLDGDAWADRTGVEWYCWIDYTPDGMALPVLASRRGRYPVEEILDDHGPLTLRRRRGWSEQDITGTSGAVPSPGQLLTHIERGMREEGLPCPQNIDLSTRSVELTCSDGYTGAVDAWAAYLRLPAPARVTDPDLEESVWQPYEAHQCGRWPGWDATVWCAVPVDPPPADVDALPTTPALDAGEVVADPPLAAALRTMLDGLPGGVDGPAEPADDGVGEEVSAPTEGDGADTDPDPERVAGVAEPVAVGVGR